MKILTRDGRDVTNTATRGCKTKEQRDHAHLMRIMKACNSCRRKKVRCNPSHRALAGSASPVEQSPRSAMKAKIPDQACKPAASAPSFEPAIIVDSTSPPLPSDSFEFGSFDLLQDAPVDEQASWDEFLRFNGELDSVFPDSFGCLPDLSPPSQSIPGRTFVSNSVAPIDASMVNAQQPDIPVADIPMLPYVERNREPHNYVDFNLYSPSSTFSEAELAIVDDLPHTSIPRRTESTEKQRGDALFSERLATSTVYGPEVCLNTRWLDHKEGSRSSLLQTWLSTNSQSLPGLDSVCQPSWQRRRPSLTTSQTTTRYIPTSPGDEAVSTTTVGFSDANTTNVQVAGDESPSSSPVLRVARFRDESVGFSQARAVNRQEPAVLASVSPPPQHFATTYDDVSTAANVGEQRFSMNAARHAVPGNENRGVHHTVESNVVQPTTAEPSADERTEHKHLQPKAAAPRPTASTSSAVGEPRSEEARTVVVANTSAVCEGSTPSGVISTSLQEARASVTSSVSVGVCLATSRNDRVDTGIDIPTTTQGWISPVTTSKSQQDLMSATVTVVAFALVAACVYSTSSNAMWTVSCAVLCTVSRMGQAIDYPASSARRLHARRGAARVATILNRIPVVA